MSGYIINLNLNPSLELPKTPEFDQPILRLFFLFKGFFLYFSVLLLPIMSYVVLNMMFKHLKANHKD